MTGHRSAGFAAVSVRGLSKRFQVRRGWVETFRAPFSRPTAEALRDVSFDVSPGEIFGVLGQNGAGKTTLFKMLSTLIEPDTGSAAVYGVEVAREPARARELLAPVLANERSLYWRLSARENVRLFASLQGLRGRVARDEERRVLAVTALDAASEKLVGTFSSGMRQRLLIARALIGRPRVLLLDEPTRSLDPISARDFRQFLRDTVVGAEGCTVLLATHDADEVWDLCDRAAVLDRGRLLACDSVRALRDRSGVDRFRAWIRRGTAAVVVPGVRVAHLGLATDPEWEEYHVEFEGGAVRAAEILRTLSAQGVAIARFEREVPSLADVLERVVAGSVEGASDAA